MRMRIRSVKPDIFADEELWDLAQETGFPILQAFEGLWCAADKEGRFEWRARALKPAILPYWSGDFSRVLDALATRGFIVKYVVSGREYGVVRTFKKHQVINNRESDSELPPPPPEALIWPVVAQTPTRDARVSDATGTPLEHASVDWEGNGNGNGREYIYAGGGSEQAVASTKPHCETPPLPPVPPELEERSTYDLVRLGYERRFVVKRTKPPSWSRTNVDHVKIIAGWVDGLGGDAAKLVDRLLDGFFREPWAAQNGFPLGALANVPAKYLEPPKGPRELRKGPVEPAPPEAWKNPTDLDAVFGPDLTETP